MQRKGNPEDYFLSYILSLLSHSAKLSFQQGPLDEPSSVASLACKENVPDMVKGREKSCGRNTCSLKVQENPKDTGR